MKRRPLAALFVAAALAQSSPLGATRSRASTRPARGSAPGPGERVCTARLAVRQTEGAAGCFIDERVTGAPGELRYPCGGGAATAVFRNGTFAGTVGADGAVTLTLRTRFHYGDGCDWQSAQSIAGTLAALTFRYDESPVAGQRGCAASCRASGVVEVRR